jgi:hypothetical protein
MDYRWMRGRQPSNELTAEAAEWMRGLPEGVKPRETAMRYGRIVNRMGATWCDPKRFHALVLSYLANDRTTKRAGFPMPVANEMRRLKAHVEARYPGLLSPWDLDVLSAQETRMEALLGGLELSIA